MAKDDAERLEHAMHTWRQAEGDYIRSAARFLHASDEAPKMSKDDLITLISLRERADRWREKYFKRQRD